MTTKYVPLLQEQSPEEKGDLKRKKISFVKPHNPESVIQNIDKIEWSAETVDEDEFSVVDRCQESSDLNVSNTE